MVCYVSVCSNFLDHKVVGCPIHISLDYMARNVLIFNLCFVFDPVVKTARYELVLKKVANYLKALEVLLLICGIVASLSISQQDVSKAYCFTEVCMLVGLVDMFSY